MSNVLNTIQFKYKSLMFDVLNTLKVKMFGELNTLKNRFLMYSIHFKYVFQAKIQSVKKIWKISICSFN